MQKYQNNYATKKIYKKRGLEAYRYAEVIELK